MLGPSYRKPRVGAAHRLDPTGAERCRFEAAAIARALPRQLAQLRIAIAPGPAPRLLVVVHLSSERTLEPVRQDSSFAEKQKSHPPLLPVVPCGRPGRRDGDDSNHARIR